MKVLTGAGNKALRAVSKPVSKFDSVLKKLIKEMRKIVVREKGVGLAAVQLGHPIRLAVIRLGHGTPNEKIISIINPVIIERSNETEIGEEGCLSLPNQFGLVERAKWVAIEFQDEKGKKRALDFEGLGARVIQHEIDHMEGILFTDRLSPARPEIL